MMGVSEESKVWIGVFIILVFGKGIGAVIWTLRGLWGVLGEGIRVIQISRDVLLPE